MRIKSCLFTKITITFLLTMVAFAGAANAQAATKSVTNLYKADTIKRVETWSKAELKKYFVDDLAAAIYKSARKDKGLGFDILYYTQNRSSIKNLKIGDEDSHYESSGQMVHTVTATFQNSGKEEEVFFTLDVDEFKIIEINYYGHDKSLSDILAAVESNRSSSVAEISSNETLIIPNDCFMLLRFGESGRIVS